MSANTTFTNALIHEQSPYLLQHAHNPVNWIAWSPSIFEEAASNNKPILLSIGYGAKWIEKKGRMWIKFIWMHCKL
jgi:uncharacterized protein YyaL (SSP411 family)